MDDWSCVIFDGVDKLDAFFAACSGILAISLNLKRKVEKLNNSVLQIPVDETAYIQFGSVHRDGSKKKKIGMVVIRVWCVTVDIKPKS